MSAASGTIIQLITINQKAILRSLLCWHLLIISYIMRTSRLSGFRTRPG